MDDMSNIDQDRSTFRWMRRAAKLTQGEVAERIGVSRPKISLYEEGHLDLAPDDLLRAKAVIQEELKDEKKGARLLPIATLLGGPEFERLRDETIRFQKMEQFEEKVEKQDNEIAELKATIAKLSDTIFEHMSRTEPKE